ncbi:MAG: hypothetical protein ABI700_03105 [Chloroflexota bacterium]
MTAVMFCGKVAVLTVARLTYRDPFASYQAIMPGQSVDAIKDYPCPLHVETVNRVEKGWCQFDSDKGVFDQVSMVEHKHIITWILFHIRSEDLRLGDLILCWGKPIDIVRNFHREILSYDMYWSNQAHARVVDHMSSRQLDFSLPVTDVSIERQWGTVEAENILCA